MFRAGFQRICFTIYLHTYHFVSIVYMTQSMITPITGCILNLIPTLSDISSDIQADPPFSSLLFALEVVAGWTTFLRPKREPDNISNRNHTSLPGSTDGRWSPLPRYLYAPCQLSSVHAMTRSKAIYLLSLPLLPIFTINLFDPR